MLGYIHFDKPGLPNNRSEMLVTSENSRDILGHSFVRITNNSANKEKFFGRIIQGPFYFPEEVSRDSALAQTAILKGDSFPSAPNYYATAIIELLGIIRDEGGISSIGIRPNPQSKVEKLENKDIKKILKLHEGDMVFAKLEGYDKVMVNLKSNDKTVLPRNIGIFGTVGSGKSNTAQVLIEEAVTASNKPWAVIIVDVEGEYVNMDQPSDQQYLKSKIKSYGREFEKLDNFDVYTLVNSYSARERGTKKVTIQTDQIDEFMLAEILGLTEPQEGALIEAIELIKVRKKHIARETSPDPALKTPIVKWGYTLKEIISTIGEALEKGRDEDPIIKRSSKGSLRPLLRKLWRLERTGVFDRDDAQPIDAPGLMNTGQVSVFDVSHDGTYEKNLLIAELLNRVFRVKASVSFDPNLPPVLLIIEEAHTFISRENKEKMAETISMLKNIARRGRKRWLSLCFISQQPAHLPNEILELCNTRIIHTIKSENNLRVLKLAAGDIAEEIWSDIPTLGIGQAVIDSPQFREPLKINIRPCKTKRGLVE